MGAFGCFGNGPERRHAQVFQQMFGFAMCGHPRHSLGMGNLPLAHPWSLIQTSLLSIRCFFICVQTCYILDIHFLHWFIFRLLASICIDTICCLFICYMSINVPIAPWSGGGSRNTHEATVSLPETFVLSDSCKGTTVTARASFDVVHSFWRKW